MSRTARPGAPRPNQPLLLRARHASHVGARPVNDTLPQRRLRPNANKERHGAGQHVVAEPVLAVEPDNPAREGDGGYVPVWLIHPWSSSKWIESERCETGTQD